MAKAKRKKTPRPQPRQKPVHASVSVPLPPGVEAVEVLVPVASKPVVTWQAKGKRLLIQIQDFFAG